MNNDNSMTTNAITSLASPTAGMMQNLTGNNDWNTPAQYINSVKVVLGSIDIDPATNHQAQKLIQAATHYTVEIDGLKQAWEGCCYMNPPYSRDLIGKFTSKFIQELNTGNITTGIVLVNAATDTMWFHLLHEHATAVCLTKGRIAFQRANNDTASVSTKKGQVGSAFFYFGDNPAAFVEEFSQYGIFM